MNKWNEESVINNSMEKVWSLFMDENIHKIMDKVEDHILIEKKENEVGAKHRQSYREGKRVETYIVETLAYEDLPEKKHKKVSFVLGKAFEITFSITLHKMDENQTKFIYEGQNKGINFVGRAMMKLGSEKSNNKVVHEFMEKVNQEALKL
ncbi:MAG: SRPBCC family protein [Psychrobacillus psychrotolerans]